MNAKKIMGAVLVALLAAALFVGAGSAAATTVADGDTVFLYESITPALAGSWSNGDVVLTTTTISGETFFAPTANFKEGIYTNGTGDNAWSLTIKYPSATIIGVGTEQTSSKTYIIANGGTLFKGDSLALTNSTGNSIVPTKYFVTLPTGEGKLLTEAQALSTIAGTVGQYKVQAYFDYSSNSPFVSSIPENYLLSGVTYIINVVSTEDVTISAAVEEAIENDIIAVTVTGKPGLQFKIETNGNAAYSSNGATYVSGDVFTMPNNGVAVIYVKAVTEGTGKVSVVSTVSPAEFDKQSVTFKINEGEINGAAEKESYYVGDNVKISGTSTAGSTLYLYIAGTNIDFMPLSLTGISVVDGKWEKKLTADDLEVKGKVWDITNKGITETGKPLDAGTYTIYVSDVAPTSTNPAWIVDEADDLEEYGTYGTILLVMKQPFLSVIDAPAVAVKGTNYEVTGTAEATDKLSVYIFGTNFFVATNGTNIVSGEGKIGDGNKNIVSFEKNDFTIKFKVNDNMAPGQYFMVIQHPMYDGVFNIAAKANQDIVKNATADATLSTTDVTTVFNVKDRQTANAAQALCDELDLQNIDDMYVKLSFVVASPKSTINPLPAEITKGSKLTVSGTTNLGKGQVVTVEMLSTAFAAVPKETVGSASFISLITKTDEDGNWEVTFDTSSLNVDEYTVSVAVGSLDSTSTKVNVIEGAPTEQPTEPQPTQTTTPTQPTETPVQTPGFGALAALAGLGAVAVLLLRRE